MDPLGEPVNAIAFSMVMLLLLLTNTEDRVPPRWMDSEDDEEDRLRVLAENVHTGFVDAHNEL